MLSTSPEEMKHHTIDDELHTVRHSAKKGALKPDVLRKYFQVRFIWPVGGHVSSWVRHDLGAGIESLSDHQVGIMFLKALR
jgi:hypothetical protein